MKKLFMATAFGILASASLAQQKSHLKKMNSQDTVNVKIVPNPFDQDMIQVVSESSENHDLITLSFKKNADTTRGAIPVDVMIAEPINTGNGYPAPSAKMILSSQSKDIIKLFGNDGSQIIIDARKDKTTSPSVSFYSGPSGIKIRQEKGFAIIQQ